MSGPDFTRLRRRFERRMDDRVRITHNPGAMTDQPMNPGTGKPGTATSPDVVVYEGKALLVPEPFDQLVEEGANPLELSHYLLHVPLAASVPADGDSGIFLASRWNSALVGQRFTVKDGVFATYVTSHVLKLQRRAAARPRAGR